jgi:hypothetical protein
MNFIEALKLAQRGKKIRKVGWDEDEYITVNGCKLIWAPDDTNISSEYTIDMNSLLQDWEIYEEKPKYSFQEALKAFNEGKNIRSSDRTYWVSRRHDYEYEETFTLRDVNATDWVIE